MNKLLTSITLLCFSVAANAQETVIKEIQKSYVEDFIAFDYDGMATHFTYPVMIMSSTTRILENPDALINYYKSLISELPENYSHSTTEVEVKKINNSTWLLASIFYRYNTNGDMFQSGTTQNFYIETNEGWKMFLRQSPAL
jgi:hypothetical protein